MQIKFDNLKKNDYENQLSYHPFHFVNTSLRQNTSLINLINNKKLTGAFNFAIHQIYLLPNILYKEK